VALLSFSFSWASDRHPFVGSGGRKRRKKKLMKEKKRKTGKTGPQAPPRADERRCVEGGSSEEGKKVR